MFSPLSEFLFPSETTAVLTAMAATLILAFKELFVRRSLRPKTHLHSSSESKLTEMSATQTRRP